MGDRPFLHLVGDHVYVSELTNGDSLSHCAQQLVAVAEAESCAALSVQPTRESMLPYFGTVGGRRVGHAAGLYEIENVVEKPTPTQAEQELIVPGLRAGHYLCFFGMHVFTPGLFALLDALNATGDRQLSPALAKLAERDRYIAFEVRGSRYNLGIHYGLLVAQFALDLAGQDRAEIRAQVVELLARQGA